MIRAVLLAAGRSRRMGTQKLLLPFAETTVVGHVLDELAASGLDGVCVVVSGRADPVAAALAGRDVQVAINPLPDADMLSSVRCGLRALRRPCEAVLVALGDQPSITAALVDEMIRAHNVGGKGIVVPTFDGLRGHPLLFSTRYRGEVLTRHDAVGLRGLLRAHADDVVELPAASDAVLSDMDYPEDYGRELDRARRPRGGRAANDE